MTVLSDAIQFQHISQEKRQNVLAFGEKRDIIDIEKEKEDLSKITLLSMKQVMAYLNVSQWVYYKLVNSHQLPTIMLGARRLVRLSALIEYLNGIETKPKRIDGYPSF